MQTFTINVNKSFKEIFFSFFRDGKKIVYHFHLEIWKQNSKIPMSNYTLKTMKFLTLPVADVSTCFKHARFSKQNWLVS